MGQDFFVDTRSIWYFGKVSLEHICHKNPVQLITLYPFYMLLPECYG